MTLQIQNGLVTLDARNVSPRQILAEWARVGGAKIVNGEKVAGPAVTLQLPGVPERQALDIILRGVSGYMLAMRQPGSAGASTFDRILILPTSVAPRNPPPPPQQAARPVVLQPPVFQEPDNQDGDGQDPQVRPPIPGVPGQVLRPPFPPGARIPPAAGDPASDPGADEDQPGTVVIPSATPANPFGVPLGSGLPGVVTPVPQPVQPPAQR